MLFFHPCDNGGLDDSPSTLSPWESVNGVVRV